MSVIPHLDKLDSLILTETQPPATANLRNQLVIVRDQIEGLEAAHARLKNDYTVLKNTTEQAIAELKEKYQEAASELEKLQSENKDAPAESSPLGILRPPELKILKHFFETDGGYSAQEVAQLFKLKPGFANLYCDSLRAKHLIEYASIVVMSNAPRKMRITPEGRKLIADRLLS